MKNTFLYLINANHPFTACLLEFYHSSNVNEVIRAILNFLIFFTKRFYTHKKHKKRKTHISQQQKKKGSVFIRLKTSKGKKVAYSLVCVLCFRCFLCFCLVASLCFLWLLLGCVSVIFVTFVLFVRVKSFRKKRIKKA